MNTSYMSRHLLSAFILFLSITGNLFAADWSGTFTPNSTVGCYDSQFITSGIGSSVVYSNNSGCNANMNVTISLQRSSSSGGPFVTISTQTRNFGNGTVTFAASLINQTGYYRCFISGSPITGTCGISSITSKPTNTVFITVHPYPAVAFNINGTEQYYTGTESYFNVTGCTPIKVNFTAGGTVTQHRLIIKEMTSAGAFIGDVYNSNWVSGAVPAPLTLPSLATSKYYTVNLQVDNGNCVAGKTSFIYANPNGPTATIGFKVNGNPLSTNCNAPSQFYKCSAYPITLTNQSTNVDKYIVLLEKSTTGMCGPYTTVYSSGNISTFPTDMKNLPGTNGTYLQSNTGFYRFTIYGKNSCGILQSLVSGNLRVDNEPTPSVAFKVNGTTLSTDCNAVSIPAFFNCAAFPITLNNLSSNISTYEIKLQHSINGPCGPYIDVYNSGSLSYLPTNLKNLPGTYGDYVLNNPGHYMIVVSGYGACGAFSFNFGIMNVIGAPTPNTQFVTTASTKPSGTPFSYHSCSVPFATALSYVKDATDNCATRVFKMTTDDVTDPNPVGKNLTVFDLTNVNGGTGSNEYTVSILSEIWQSGTWTIMNHNNQPEIMENIVNVPLNALLYYDDIIPEPQYNNYFSSGATNGDIFRITIIVENECGSASQSQIIQYNTTSLRIVTGGGTTEEEQEQHLVQDPVVFPNPVTSDVRFEVPTFEKDKISISLYDLKGAHVMDIVKDVEATEGTSVYSSNLDNLTSGMYLYQITVNNTIHNGKLSKK
ncbi:hypothetical protein D3C71_333870 [compost metagenome]